MNHIVCFRHPKDPACTRCYHCKRYICIRCRYHKSRHYFCGVKCHLLFLLRNAQIALKKQRLNIILIWNAVITLLLLWMLAARPFPVQPPAAEEATQSVIPPPGPAKSLTERRFTPEIDSLLQSKAPLFSKTINHRLYSLSLPVRRGWVITIWNNDDAIFSGIAENDGQYQYPVELNYGSNAIRVGVWNHRQKLVFDNYWEITYRHPLVEQRRYSIDQGVSTRPRISLTFDGGSTENGAREILNILSEKGIKTTLFLTGQFIERYPSLVLGMMEDGHEIANHTYNHPHLTTYTENRVHITAPDVNRRFVQQQLLKTDSLFHLLTGKRMAPFWRAPYGEFNQQILDWAAEIGYQHIRWTRGFDTFDWVEDSLSTLYRTPQQVLESILSREPAELNGAIVLMHLGTHRNDAPLYTILPRLIDEIKKRGITPVSVTQLLTGNE